MHLASPLAGLAMVLLISLNSPAYSAEAGPRLDDTVIEDVLEGFEERPDAGEEKRKEPGLEEILEGFETPEEKPPAAKEALDLAPSRLDVAGSVTLGSSYNYARKAPPPGETDYRGLSRLRLELDLEIRYRLTGKWTAQVGGSGFYDFAYSLNGRGEYTEEVLEEYEKEAELRETYLQGTLAGNLDLKTGRQTVVWGKSDNIRVTDVLNPLDNREPGIVDIEDLRLPVYMTRLDYYAGNWSLTGIAVHKVRFGKNPVFGSDFYPLGFRPPPEQEPHGKEYAIALSGILTGWDVSFYWARMYDEQTHVALDSGLPVLRHSRLTMLGTAVNVARGNWLLKSEAAWFDGLKFSFAPDSAKSRIDFLVGVEYSGFQDATVSIEAVNRHINGFVENMALPLDNAEEDQLQWVLRYQRDFMHDTLHATVLASTFGIKGGDGALQRYSLEYDYTDAISFTAGMVNYKSGEAPGFRGIGDNDRLFFEARYSF